MRKDILLGLQSDINQLQVKLNDFRDSEFPDVEDVDLEKILLGERMKILEEQQRELAEKYRGTEQLNTKLRTDVYKFKQKIKYKANEDERNGVDVFPKDASDDEKIEILLKKIENQKTIIDHLENKIVNIEIKSDVESFFPKPVSKTTNVEESEEKPADTSLEKRGYLQKRGGKNNSKWQKRFFELGYSKEHKMYLLLYRQKNEKGPVKGSIPLAWCTFQSSLIEYRKGSKIDASFAIIPQLTEKKKKNYYLSASSVEEMKEWLTVLEKASKVHPEAQELFSGTYKINDKAK